MQKTKIEWCDYSRNPIKGYCPNNCPYCYAHRRYNRFKWDKTLRFDERVLPTIRTIKEPSRIFIGSMIDMYHPDIPSRWVKEIIKFTRNYPGHTFITLTKFPENLYKFDFPENWWIGITIDNFYKLGMINTIRSFSELKITGKRFISAEPLLTDLDHLPLQGIDWLIIGGLTPKPIHEKSWIDYIVKHTDDLHIPVS